MVLGLEEMHFVMIGEVQAHPALERALMYRALCQP
jgi:hypothetical protein